MPRQLSLRFEIADLPGSKYTRCSYTGFVAQEAASWHPGLRNTWVARGSPVGAGGPTDGGLETGAAFWEPQTAECVSLVQRMAADNWQAYMDPPAAMPPRFPEPPPQQAPPPPRVFTCTGDPCLLSGVFLRTR